MHLYSTLRLTIYVLAIRFTICDIATLYSPLLAMLNDATTYRL
jgi:hypothetical protein